MRTHLPLLSVLSVLALVGSAACKKPPPPPPVVDAAPPPPPADTTTNLTPLTDDDAGQDAGQDAGHKPGGFVDPKVARIKQCCGALRGQAKALGPSPEAGLFTGAATQCDTIAAQAGAKGTAPELGFLRALRTIPPICQGL
jgi:hypothetical protein